MKPAWNVLLTTLAIAGMAGCLGASDSKRLDGSTTVPEPSVGEGPAALPTPPAVEHGLLGANVTRAESATYWVASDQPVNVTFRVNGSETTSLGVQGNHSWKLPLEIGQQSFEVRIEAPGFHDAWQDRLVRLARTRLVVNYGVFHGGDPPEARVEGYDVWIDVDARPSAPAYAAQGAQHLDAFNAHDQLVTFTQSTGIPVEVEWFAKFQGFSVSKIDGAGSPLSSSSPPYWCYSVNGASPDGISIQKIQPGDFVAWTLGTCTPLD